MLMTGLVTGLLAFVFIIAGTIKVTPKLSVEAHKQVVSNSVRNILFRIFLLYFQFSWLQPYPLLFY